jgi:hypothetical protein
VRVDLAVVSDSIDPGTGSIAQLSYTLDADASLIDFADLNPQNISVLGAPPYIYEIIDTSPLSVTPKPGKVGVNDNEVAISPLSEIVNSGESIQFSISDRNRDNLLFYTWKITSSIGSIISADGLYVAGENNTPNGAIDIVTMLAERDNEPVRANAKVKVVSSVEVSLFWDLSYEEMWGVRKDENLLLLRVFRDEVLLNTKVGREYVSMLYDNSLEIVTLLLQEPSLTIQTKEVVDELSLNVESLLYTDEIEIRQDTIDRFLSLLDDFEVSASPKLKAAIKKVKREIMEDKVSKQLSITINE